ncbi:MAG TPA: NDP-sugar synthase [Ilumatobacteraceae bacterium]|nr:NDP-sugar synthase [Ilumatobacteraceae bacterium]
MRAVVLVGGFGTRMRPLTNHVPKSMLPVGHEPMISRLVGRLVEGGVTDVTLALGFKAEPFLEAFLDGHCHGARLHYAVESEPLDTAGAIRFAAEHSGIDDTFVVVNGDIITDLDVSMLLAVHRAAGAEGTIHLTPVEDPSSFGIVELDGDGRVERFVEKPPAGTMTSNLINAGTYVLEPSVVERIAPGRPVSLEREVFPDLVERRTLFAAATDDYWIDAGRPELYLRANLDLVNGQRSERVDPVAPGATVDPSATINLSLIGPGVVVEERASVTESVVLAGASIGRGATVERSIVMGRVGPDAVVSDAVVGADGDVPAGTTLADARLPAPG